MSRTTILEATRRLALAEGFGGLTMRKVAAEVGVTAPALYRHFENKGELLGAMLDGAREAFLVELRTALQGRTPRERLDRAQEAYLRFALEQPQAYELLMLTRNQFGMFGAPDSMERWRDEAPPSFQVCVDIVAECMESGDLAPGDSVEVALSLSACAHGLVTLYLAGRFGEDADAFRQLYAACLENLYRGIRTP